LLTQAILVLLPGNSRFLCRSWLFLLDTVSLMAPEPVFLGHLRPGHPFSRLLLVPVRRW
jgi:hypothetical protein